MDKLYESWGNLARIDRTLLGSKNKSTESFNHENGIGPNSQIVLKNIRPHNFTNLMRAIDEEENLGMAVVRCHRKQVVAICKDGSAFGRRWNNYSIRLTDMAWEDFGYKLRQPRGEYGKQISVDNAARVKTYISEIVKDYYLYSSKSDASVKPQWDVLFVYKDPANVDIQKNRIKSREGMVPVPHDKEYNDYLRKLKEGWADKCKEYIRNHMKDYQNAQDLFNDMLDKGLIPEIKYKGVNYKFERNSTEVGKNSDRASDNYLEYRAINPHAHPGELYIVLGYKGLIPYIKELRVSPDRYDYIGNSQREGDWYSNNTIDNGYE